MHRIQTMSSYLYYFFSALLVLSPLITLMYWLFLNAISIDKFEPYFSFGLSWKSPGVSLPSIKEKLPIPLEHRLIGLAGAVFSQIPLYIGYAVLRQLFGLYRSGIIFSSENVKCYKWLGVLMILASVFFIPLGEGVSMMALTLSNPPGERMFSIGFGSSGIEIMLVGVLVMIISWIMEEGRKIDEERAYTV